MAADLPAPTNWRGRSTITVEESATVLGIGRSSAYDLARSGEIPTLRLGRRFVVPVAALRRMLGESLTNEIDPGVDAPRSMKANADAGDGHDGS